MWIDVGFLSHSMALAEHKSWDITIPLKELDKIGFFSHFEVKTNFPPALESPERQAPQGQQKIISIHRKKIIFEIKRQTFDVFRKFWPAMSMIRVKCHILMFSD